MTATCRVCRCAPMKGQTFFYYGAHPPLFAFKFASVGSVRRVLRS